MENIQKMSGENGNNTEKVREFCHRKKVGTLMFKLKCILLVQILSSGVQILSSGLPWHRENGIRRSIFQTGKTKGICPKNIENMFMFLHGEFNSSTGKIWRWKKK